MSRDSLKFVHMSDLHLDRQIVGGKLRLPFEKAEIRRRELRNALTDTVRLAQDEKAELLIIAGDLWEEDQLAPDTLPFVLDTLGHAGLPVVITPGNHDYFSSASHYSDDIAMAINGRAWPENVHVFRDYEFKHVELPGLDDVSITGLAYRSNKSVNLRRLGSKIKVSNKATIKIAVIHGSREDHLPPGKMRTMPFTDAELLSQPFDYTALGHYHTRAVIDDDQSKVRAAYPGSTCFLTADEGDEHGVFVGKIKPGGIDPNDIKFIPIDKRRLHRISIDISGLQHVQAVEARIQEELESHAVKNQDLVTVDLTGTYPQGARINLGRDILDESCFHFVLNTSAVRPEWQIDEESEETPRTTESMFRSQLKEMIDEALSRGDNTEANRLQNALYYGLDALHSEKITPRQTS